MTGESSDWTQDATKAQQDAEAHQDVLEVTGNNSSKLAGGSVVRPVVRRSAGRSVFGFVGSLCWWLLFSGCAVSCSASTSPLDLIKPSLNGYSNSSGAMSAPLWQLSCNSSGVLTALPWELSCNESLSRENASHLHFNDCGSWTWEPSTLGVGVLGFTWSICCVCTLLLGQCFQFQTKRWKWRRLKTRCLKKFHTSFAFCRPSLRCCKRRHTQQETQPCQTRLPRVACFQARIVGSSRCCDPKLISHKRI